MQKTTTDDKTGKTVSEWTLATEINDIRRTYTKYLVDEDNEWILIQHHLDISGMDEGYIGYLEEAEFKASDYV